MLIREKGLLQVFFTIYFRYFSTITTFFPSLYMKMEKYEEYDADKAETTEKVPSFSETLYFCSIRSYLAANGDINRQIYI